MKYVTREHVDQTVLVRPIGSGQDPNAVKIVWVGDLHFTAEELEQPWNDGGPTQHLRMAYEVLGPVNRPNLSHYGKIITIRMCPCLAKTPPTHTGKVVMVNATFFTIITPEGGETLSRYNWEVVKESP